MVNYIINYKIKDYIPKILTIVDNLGINEDELIKDFFYISKENIKDTKIMKDIYINRNEIENAKETEKKLELELKQLKNYENSIIFMEKNNLLKIKNGIYKITKNGKKHFIKYRKNIQKQKGFENYLEYLDDMFQEMGYESFSDLKLIYPQNFVK